MLKFLHNDDLGKLLVRLTVAVLILAHGISKILNPESIEWLGGVLSGIGLPAFLAYGVFIGEVIAALMVIAGLYSRIGGLLIAGNMLVAVLLVHMGQLFSLTQNGGWALELQAFFLAGGLAVALLGSGKYAVKAD